jgi:hypothetical protein
MRRRHFRQPLAIATSFPLRFLRFLVFRRAVEETEDLEWEGRDRAFYFTPVILKRGHGVAHNPAPVKSGWIGRYPPPGPRGGANLIFSISRTISPRGVT